jgi:undecaprenyl-diphosphatase
MKRKSLVTSAGFLAAFVLWTILVCVVDLRPVGPNESSLGLAGINQFIHGLTGVNFKLYNLTDWLGLVPVAVCIGFGALGVSQWVTRKRIRKVDFSILLLGGFYIVTVAVYLLFEEWIINYRPVLINGVLEASYPSSTTMLTLCVMTTAQMQLKTRIPNKTISRMVGIAIKAFTGFMVIGRFLSGVHWFSDIVAGCLLSAGLVMLYRFGTEWEESHDEICKE